MRPSIVEQVPAEWVDARLLKPSPRNYNASTCCIHGKVWMAYRSHRMEKGGRCGIAICELEDLTPHRNQWLNLGGATGLEHHEDPRLFVFNGKLHVAFSETTFPHGRPYIAVQKYARLERAGGDWKVAEVFRPHYGRNHSEQMEKNWQFFEYDGRLHAIYSAEPEHVVIEIHGDKIVKEHKSAGVTWPWGEIRGGSPPMSYGLDHFITFFHSSTPAVEGSWRRYWMGAYVIEAKAPFTVTRISPRPIAGGSERDNHGLDPRTPDSWKPFVVFPGGAIQTQDGWDVALGVNDWRIAIAHLKEIELTPPNLPLPHRYFRVSNASRPTRLMQMDRQPLWIDWEPASVRHVGAPAGYASISDPWLAEELAEVEGVSEVSKAEYEQAVLNKGKRSYKLAVG